MITRTTTTLLAVPFLTACAGVTRAAPPPLPPSAAPRGWDEMAQPVQTVTPGIDEVASKWRLPESSPWAAYQKDTLFAALGSTERVIELPHVQELDAVMDAERAAEIVGRVGLPDNTMWVVDLRGAASVAFGATLSQRSARAVAPVLTFNNWPAQNELVPAEETLAALVTMRPTLPPEDRSTPWSTDGGTPVFLLDAWRLAYKDQWPDDEVTDNRYMLTPSDLPSPEVLQARGIHQVLYVVENLAVTKVEEDDLHETFAAYQEAGITIAIVDLAWLFALDAPARWDQALYIRRLPIEPRKTVTHDEWFFRRAHSGFGGIHVYAGGNHGFGMGIGIGGGHGGHGGG